MKRETEDLGPVLKEQLHQLYIEIICAKRLHRDLLRMIWPEKLELVAPGQSEPTLAVRIDSYIHGPNDGYYVGAERAARPQNSLCITDVRELQT